MNTTADQVKVGTAKRPARAATFVLLSLALLLLAGAGYLWATMPAGPAKVEGDLRPVGFSLGLDDPDVARIDRDGARQFWSGGAMVMPNGFAAGAAKIWPGMELAAPDPALAPVKIVPTGGLFPYYRSDSFAAEVESFVRRGGSLICFGQPLGAMYGALPGAPQGVGWAETACPAKEAIGEALVVLDHPATAALAKGEITVHFAGFFTRIPGTDQTQVLLRDAATGQPVLTAYRFGRGLVVASTLTSDAAAIQERLGSEEATLLRELVTWVQAGGGSIPRYMPGDLVEMSYRLEPSSEEASQGFAEVVRPDGSRESFNLPLPEGDESQVTRVFSITEPRGIWRILSYRQGAGGQAAGPISSAWFAVGRSPAAKQPANLHYTVDMPGTHLVKGAILPITVRLWNDGETESEVTYRGPTGKNTVRLAPGKGRTLREEIPLDKTGMTTVAYDFYGPAGERLGTIKRRIEAGEPDRVFLSISQAGLTASPGQVVQVDLNYMSVNPGVYKADCWLRLVHNGRVLWQEPRRPELTGAYSRKETVKVPVPQGVTGRLVLQATLVLSGKELARAWTEIVAK